MKFKGTRKPKPRFKLIVLKEIRMSMSRVTRCGLIRAIKRKDIYIRGGGDICSWVIQVCKYVFEN